MNWRLRISLRYLTSSHREKFISIISLISILGVAVGVAALIIVLGVMSGFNNELKEKLIGTYSHITVESEYGLEPTAEMFKEITTSKHVLAGAYYIYSQALLRSRDSVFGVIVKGIDPTREVKVNKIGSYITKGAIALEGDGIVIGSELATKLGLKLGNKITLVSPSKTQGMEFVVTGIFTSGMYEYDANLVYLSLANGQKLFNTRGLVSGIALKADDAFNAINVKKELKAKIKPPLVVKTWMDLNKNLMAALKLEKTMMFIALTLIVIVACFNIASGLIMTVLEKTKDIGILKSIGSTKFDVMCVFAAQGMMIGVLGTFTGTGLGVGISYLLEKYQFINLPKDIYYIDRLPVDLNYHDITLIIISSLFISLLATIYPAYKASRLDPIEALRYE